MTQPSGPLDDWKWKLVFGAFGYAYRCFIGVLMATGVYRAATWFGVSSLPAALGTIGALMYFFADLHWKVQEKRYEHLLKRLEEIARR